MLVGALLLVASVPLLGGDLRRLADVRLQVVWLLPLALALQVLVLGLFPDAPHDLVAAVHVGTYLYAAAFVLVNRHVPGLVLLGLGGALNGVTIALNGGTLPASADALRRAGREVEHEGFTNSGVLEDPRLAWLGDVFAVPAGVPFANVFSIGDVVILVGAGWALHRICRTPPPVVEDVLLDLDVDELAEELVRARAAVRAAHARTAALTAELARSHAGEDPVLVALRARRDELLAQLEVLTAPSAPVLRAVPDLPVEAPLAERVGQAV